MANVIRRYRLALPTPQYAIDAELPLGAQIVSLEDAQPYVEMDITIDAAGSNDLDTSMASRGWTFVVETPATPLGVKSLPFHIPTNTGSAIPRYNLAAAANMSVGFVLPEDFGSLVSVELVAYPNALAAGNSLALTSYYGAPGQSYLAGTESDSILFSGPANDLLRLDVSSVLTGVVSPYTAVAINLVNTDLGANLSIMTMGLVRYVPNPLA